MKLAALLLAPLALGSCDKLFGFDHVPTIDGPAALRTVTCDYLWQIAGTTSSGAPVETTMPAPASYARVVLGATEIPISADNGTFSFQAPAGVPWELRLDTPGIVQYFDRDSDTCHLVTQFFHRPNVPPATQSTPVRFNTMTGAPIGGTVRIASTGVRALGTATQLGVGPGSSAWGSDWSTTEDLSSEPAGLLDASKGDRLVLEFFANTADYQALTQAVSVPQTLMNGASTVIAATPMTLPTRCVAIASNEGQTVAALQAASLRPSGMASSSWAITSSAIASMGPGENQLLALGTHGDLADHTATVSYGSPFTGETDVFQVGAAVAHPVSTAGATSSTIYTYATYYDQVPSGGSCATTMMARVPPAAFATGASVGGVALATDGQMLTLDRSQPVPVHVDLGPGELDDVVVFLYEIGASAGATTITNLALYYPFAHDFAIAPSQLVTGHTYMLSLAGRVGVPGSAMGDFRTYSYPRGATANPTSTFTIAN